MKKAKTWKSKLDKLQLAHCKDMGFRTLTQIRQSVMHQETMEFPCWCCVSIGRTLGIEFTLTTFHKCCGVTRASSPAILTITLEQAKQLAHGTTIYHATNKNADGSPQRWRVNGKAALWKTAPELVRVPIKHGLHRYGYLTEDNLNQFTLTEGV